MAASAEAPAGRGFRRVDFGRPGVDNLGPPYARPSARRDETRRAAPLLEVPSPMASFHPQDFGLDEPPPRPTTPPLRRGFVFVLMALLFAALLVYGVPYVAEQTGYAWESGRARAATEALAKLDKSGVVEGSSTLFRLATTAVSPAVVNIQAVRFRKDAGANGPGFGGGGGGLFGRGALESFGIGSGVVVDREKAYIVTNNHVVANADQITVRLSRGAEMKARLVGADPKTDLAVIQVPGPLRVAAVWGDSDKLASGDWVIAIGSPYMLDHTVTAGIVSATGRNNLQLPGLEQGAYQDFIQTDAAINPGNSGGPLVDLSGKVVGINTAILTGNSFRGGEGVSQSGGFEGIGLAIPAAMAKRVADDLIKNGKVVRGFLGVMIDTATPDVARRVKSPDARGAVVIGVQAGSPAERAGLKAGDIIEKFDGKAVVDAASLRIKTADAAPGAEVTLDVVREAKPLRIKVALVEQPAPDSSINAFGFSVREIPAGAEGDPLPGVAIDRVAMGSPAARAGLRPGVRILGVGDQDVRTRAEFEKAVAEVTVSRGLPLRVRAPDGQTITVLVGGPPPQR
jgi:serine protease Do